jgi:hypothetical protein
MNLAVLDTLAATAANAVHAHIDDRGPDPGPALAAYQSEKSRLRREHDAERPAGKLAPEHPWHVQLRELGEAFRNDDALVNAVELRLRAFRRGGLDAVRRQEAADDAATDAANRRHARAAREIERREERTGRPLDPSITDAIVMAYVHGGRP